jgi:Rho termination factor, N-terminal domain
MTKAELESKHLAELHALAAEADVPRYRMLRREELIEKLSDGNGGPRREQKPPRDKPPRDRERPPRRRREGNRDRRPREREERPERPVRKQAPEPPAREPKPAAPEPTPAARADASKPKRKRRRRFGRRSKALRAQDLLTPPPGRQALVYGEGRAGCTALLREIAAELADGSIALLVDPSPEELADWKREVPRAELVVAAQTRHASDALAQAARRAEAGEHVTLLVDSLTRLEDADAAKEIFDGGLGLTAASGSLTVVAALERQHG